jgi:hypothetical protein
MSNFKLHFLSFAEALYNFHSQNWRNKMAASFIPTISFLSIYLPFSHRYLL